MFTMPISRRYISWLFIGMVLGFSGTVTAVPEIGQLVLKAQPMTNGNALVVDMPPPLQRRKTASYAQFEFAPPDGTGMGTECACAPVTGARGEVVSFSRASAATCTKGVNGLRTTGIANGDVVYCGMNAPRVERNADGALGLLVESARTNFVLRSAEMDNVVWLSDQNAGAATITADFATAPDGTLSADRVQYPAVTATTYSGIAQPAVCPTGPFVASCYMRANSGSPRGDLIVGANLGNGSAVLTTASWTRVWATGTNTTGSATFLTVGSYGVYNGAQSSADILFGGCQCESGSYPSAYIPTTSAMAMRLADSGATITLSSAIGPSGSMAATAQWVSNGVGAVNIVSLGNANNWTLYRNSASAAGYQINSSTTTPTVAAMGTTTHRTAIADNSGSRMAYWDGASVTAPAASLGTGQTVLVIGAGSLGVIPIDGLVSRVCVDPLPSRCR